MTSARQTLVQGLNVYVANLAAWYVKWHNLHWNVQGPQFFGLHEKLEELYDGIANELDAVAERVLMLGGRPPASLSAYLELTSVEEMDSQPLNGEEVVRQLAADVRARARQQEMLMKLAADSLDPVTEGFMATALSDSQKLLWMLTAWQGDGAI